MFPRASVCFGLVRPLAFTATLISWLSLLYCYPNILAIPAYFVVCDNALMTMSIVRPGSHLVDRLMQEGHQVTVLDNLSSQVSQSLRIALTYPTHLYSSPCYASWTTFPTLHTLNVSISLQGLGPLFVAHWIDHPNFLLLRHDVTQRILLEVHYSLILSCRLALDSQYTNPTHQRYTTTSNRAPLGSLIALIIPLTLDSLYANKYCHLCMVSFSSLYGCFALYFPFPQVDQIYHLTAASSSIVHSQVLPPLLLPSVFPLSSGGSDLSPGSCILQHRDQG